MKIRPVGTEIFHATDLTKLIIALRKFANTPIKNGPVNVQFWTGRKEIVC